MGWENLKTSGKIGVVVIVIAALFGGYQAIKHLSQPPSSSQPVVSKTYCQLTVTGLGLIGAGLRDHEETKAILESVGVLGNFACQNLVNQWQSGGSGAASVGGQNKSLSGDQVQQIPSNVQNIGLQHVLDCINKYGSGLLEELCYKYQK